MSTGNVYPPQAFTREMLSQAFIWLQAQPESVREMARNPEALIALYLKTQRSQMHNQKKMESQSTNIYADAPVSAQNFMTDLKSLAEGLKQFDDPTPQNLPPPPHHQPAGAQANHSQNGHHTTPNFAAQLRNEISPAQQAPQARLQQPSPLHNPAPSAQSPQAPQLNSNSQYMIREVKEKFNLSSDVEALNMLVAIAYKNLKSLID